MSDTAEGAAEAPIYSYRPRMIGGGCFFRLGVHSLEWNLNGYSGQTAYPMIARVRLGYRPSNLGNRRFMAEIWPRQGVKLEIASASYKSLVAMEDQGPAYRDFMRGLHQRIVAAGGDCRFDTGFSAWRWWPMVAVSAAAIAAMAYVAFMALGNGDAASILLIGGFMLVFGWQMWPLISRNRPERYDPRNIPERILP